MEKTGLGPTECLVIEDSEHGVIAAKKAGCLVYALTTSFNKKRLVAAGADYVGGEELINEIKKTEKTDFAVAVAEPDMMKSLSQIAKILGTRGLMPSPKNETVTPNPAKAVQELKKGKVSFKNDTFDIFCPVSLE